MSSDDFDWPEECIDELRILQKAGISASGIASRLNEKFGTDLSRSAVCTKIRRMAMSHAKPSAPRRIQRAIYCSDTIDTHPLQLIKAFTQPEQSA